LSWGGALGADRRLALKRAVSEAVGVADAQPSGVKSCIGATEIQATDSRNPDRLRRRLMPGDLVGPVEMVVVAGVAAGEGGERHGASGTVGGHHLDRVLGDPGSLDGHDARADEQHPAPIGGEAW
jgi:hypothetical protein